MVEAQHRVSTMRVTDTLDEQRILEELIEEVKPPLPAGCEDLHYLLYTPFRYAPYPNGSRFRRAAQREGVFYASEQLRTAFAELSFYRLLFFAAAPDAELPGSAAELTAIRVSCRTAFAIDVTRPPFASGAPAWTHLTDYAPCQQLADAARASGVQAIRYRSARDPDGGANLALLHPAAFGEKSPLETQTWRMLITRLSVRLLRNMPGQESIEFSASLFRADPRLAAY